MSPLNSERMISSAFTLEAFEGLVAEALTTLPPRIQAMMDNVAVLVAEQPTGAQRRSVKLGPHEALYGLYEGVPLTRRTSDYGMVLPDRITIFMFPMVLHHRTPEGIREQVRRTVLHEIGHHFGMNEDDLDRLGY